ncbi:Ino eighty subunit 1 [Candida viswanathii]|uniref:Ino eighty subunit 1 n=1 Tax=Candida viswanathii TaxID=5486 RepID=A0A367XNX4_9ASCO|nr:Ino eighty subunit 1 [Candida viswanathii]
MSYDPIHDTFKPSSSQPQQHSLPPSSGYGQSSSGSPPQSINNLLDVTTQPVPQPYAQPHQQYPVQEPALAPPAPLPQQLPLPPPISQPEEYQNQFTPAQAPPPPHLPDPTTSMSSSPPSETKKAGNSAGALSISSLVSSGSSSATPSAMPFPGNVQSLPQHHQKVNSISSLINTFDAHNEELVDDDYDETDVNSSVVGEDEEYVATPPPSKSQKSSNTSASGSKQKKKKNNIANAKLSLKKADGEAFWRKDIQYDFLKALFDDTTPCFTNSFEKSNITNCNNNEKISFGELYIRTLAESSKSSRVLKEKLIRDSDLGKAVAKVCILVNVGRMNTTINFVPEMKSTLRTYHSIPSLQTGPKGGTVQQLQDTPRLKSILKAVCEGEENNVNLLNCIIANPPKTKPNTNIIQLLFLLSNAIHGVPYMDDQPNSHLLEFFVNTKIHPQNRANRFLWLLYTFLETNFTKEELSKNPFGGERIPPIEWLEELEVDQFDQDLDYERTYADAMFQARMQYLANPDDEQYKEHSRRLQAYPSSKKREAEEHEVSESEEGEDSKRSAPLKKKIKRNNPSIPSPLSRNVITVNSSTRKHYDEHEGKDVFKTNLKDAITFPVEGLKDLTRRYSPSPFVPTEPEEGESVSHHCEIVELSKPMVQEVRTASKASTASFNKKITILGNWLYRYFKYKKSIGNKLLGIEWEDIRYDLIHGVESYLYESFGKSLNLHKLLNGHEEESGDKAQLKGEPGTGNGASSSSSNTHNGADDEELEFHFDYFPLRDYDKANEKYSFILHLTGFVNDWFISKLGDKMAHEEPKRISFDLEKETVSI